jgi:transposase
MIERHLEGICQYFAHHTTSGMTEGFNTRIKLIKRQVQNDPNFGTRMTSTSAPK